MLDPIYCRKRQKQLVQMMQSRRLDAVVLGSRRHAYYFSAHLADWRQRAACIIFADGRSWLICANEPAAHAAADDVVAYPAKLLSTLQPDQPRLVAEAVLQRLSAAPARRVGLDTSSVSSQLALMAQNSRELSFIDDALWQMRRIKDSDELELMKQAVRCCEAMYDRARQIIEPGVSELRVFGELHSVAVACAGEPLSAPLGNDFTRGGGGGPPRAKHTAHAGELYILDLGPAYRGYFADNTRTFSVDHRPTDAQYAALEAVMGCHRIVQNLAKPGARCREMFGAVDEHLKSAAGRGLQHHLGHGVGLQPHEFPHLNPHWDDVLQQGEIIAIEPGIYGLELGGGLRIENQYRVTTDGVQNLLSFPTDLI